uniref:Uncharacterized protein n=1 Tax=Utricularia reniformis TaxID=192314 RepID=A0A1Y0B1V3_9LAMI|nr:hypothetical protein AEK19_MT1154 [Utricularia reniformis]ART31368.1 hypothetical protein AEK19_MT1154 [Utricularia reniformis]
MLSRKDSYNLAKLSNAFWNKKYPDIVNLMELISIISRFCSAMDKAVVYSIPYFDTIQDSMSFTKEVWGIAKRDDGLLSVYLLRRGISERLNPQHARFIRRMHTLP